MDAEQEAAASRIAAAKKGKQARKEAQEQKDAASKVAAMEKGRRHRKETAERQKAAATLQARQRGNRQRGKAEKVGQRYYTPSEVAAHNRADDLWVSIFQKVYDLTPLVEANKGSLVQPMIEAAGTDLTHWFDPVTKNVRTYVDPETELEVPFTPMGAFLHCPPATPTAQWSSNIGKPWWKDRALAIGALTAKTRKVKLFNMLNKVETTLEVCSEETLEEIQRRYLAFNGHSASYTWKRTDSTHVARILNMRETLDANGIPDESLQFDALSMDEDDFIPIVHLYFSDDLTVA
jgi:cytochrome b involved in lipid metabolism